MDRLLQGVFHHNLADEVPDLVPAFGSKQDEPPRGIHLEEGHAIDHKTLFGELKAESFLFIFVFFGDNTQAEPPLLGTLFSDVVQGKEGSVVGKYNSVLKVVGYLSDFMDF